uniref:lactosylceramide 4-alpha-galactosyltransferase-like n=1 Tax=Erigeron canadensis TaxID=72917 RepID=UPI001CB8D847|nr:lactosylceramide 4-alpha-galactosyltransferase-like [Erigeron canadensis]
MEFINNKRSVFALISLIFLFLLSSNGVSIFSVKIPSFSSSSSSTARPSRNLISLPNHETPSQILNTHFISQTLSPESPLSGAGNPRNFISGETHNIRNTYPDVNPGLDPNTLLPHLRKSHSFEIVSENLSESRNKQILKMLTAFGSTRRRRGEEFPARVKEFYSSKKSNETSVTSSCKVKFFMTWISSLNSFNERAFHCIESIFKTHPNACVLIVSNSLDSIKGRQILKPFTEKGFKVIAISPDFEFLFKNTMAESWFSKLVRGHIHPGVTPIGQNLSNLLRFSLLYKYGGVYIDFDIMILKSFAKLKNSIGAITIDPNTKNWSRLNNAVLVFDKMHPLVYKFIEEFALTFNGNKWGHNGPYLISRVVSRLQGRPGFNFTVLPPTAFYPVNWDKVRVLFRGAKNETESKLLKTKYEQMRNQSYSVHLWNKQSRWFHIEEGSIVRKILSDYCVFCNATSHDVIATTAIED